MKKSAKRIAPEGGYTFGTKRQYRRDVWAAFRNHIRVPRSEAVCMLMPSLEGKEIEVALANGFREHNLHVVDRNPAIVATLKRRYPKIVTYGVDVTRALTRAIENGISFDVINLDLCGCLSSNLALTVNVAGIAMKPGSCLSVTMLRGREKTEMLEIAGRGILEFDFWRNEPGFEFSLPSAWRGLEVDLPRLLWLTKVLSVDLSEPATDAGSILSWMPRLKATGKYKSSAGSQTMRWAMWQTEKPYKDRLRTNMHPVGFDFLGRRFWDGRPGLLEHIQSDCTKTLDTVCA